jgi:DNA polymerase-4
VTVPRILLADCDQMFVAVARLVDPDGAGRAPLLVVGGSASSRGVVCSASYEVRAFGVRSGMPISQAVRRCPQAMYVPVPRTACGEKSREVRSALDRWSPRVEAASIDEFYLDLTGTEALYRHEPLEETAGRLRADVRERTALSLSVGGGTNRLVAKLAAERAKPKPGTGGSGVLVVAPGDEADFLATHQLAELPGVGPRLQETLRRHHRVSVRDALAMDRPSLQRWLGERTGAWLFGRIRGQGGAGVEPNGDAKSRSREETFPEELASDEALETELLRLVTRLGAELRADRLATRCVTVKLRDHDFRTRQASHTLPEPIDSERGLYLLARGLLAKLRARRRVAARLVGVSLSRFSPMAGAAQLDLIRPATDPAPVESGRDRALARAVDRVNSRFGRQSLAPARLQRPGAGRERDRPT